MMKETLIPDPVLASPPTSRGMLRRVAAGLVMRQLENLSNAELTLVDGGQARRFGQPSNLRATLEVLDPRFWSDVAFGGSLGAAESYILGRWTTDDLTTICRIFARNLDLADDLESGWARLSAPAAKAFHWLHRNTRPGSAGNIQAHYDLGNDFFGLFLDDTMNYSGGIFEQPDATMRDASIEKMDRACRKLDLRPSDHLLEIGTGWGGLAVYAASRFGCRITTTTVSREQFAFASERVRQAGLEHRVQVLLCDYRDLTGRYDKIVSIEMIEAVGHEFLATYFGKCNSLLQTDGLMLLQGILMAEHRYERYRKSVDFIQRYVFPGSCLPSLAAISSAVARTTDLRPIHLEDLTPHYAETLRHWRRTFLARREDVRRLGHSDAFMRLWEFYLCYCEAGFEERTVSNVQLLLAKPGNRRPPIPPLWEGK